MPHRSSPTPPVHARRATRHAAVVIAVALASAVICSSRCSTRGPVVAPTVTAAWKQADEVRLAAFGDWGYDAEALTKLQGKPFKVSEICNKIEQVGKRVS